MPEVTTNTRVASDGTSGSSDSDFFPVCLTDACVSWGVQPEPVSGQKGTEEGKTEEEIKTKGKHGGAVVQPNEEEDAPPSPEQISARTPPAHPAPVLSSLQLAIKKGELVAVVGPVGCGKSSLCNALLGA